MRNFVCLLVWMMWLKSVCVLLCFIDLKVRKIRNEASSCPGIFSISLRLLCRVFVCLFVWLNKPRNLFVCLFVLLNKTRTVKPPRRFHSCRLSFTQDGLAFSTKPTRRALQVQQVDRMVRLAFVLLYFIDLKVRKIRNEASSCLGIFSKTLRFYYVASSSPPPSPSQTSPDSVQMCVA